MSARDFLLPDLGEGLEDAEIERWLVQAGDAVELNQPLVEVTTAKATVEVPSPWAGVVERLHAAEGDLVRVGAPLVTIRLTGPDEEQETDGSPAAPPLLVGYGATPDANWNPSTSVEPVARSATDAGAHVAATPAVRALAKQLGVNLTGLAGTGNGGRITREDVEAAAGATPAGPSNQNARAGRTAVRGVRRLVAERMTRSVREIPQVTTFLTVDATELASLREELAAANTRAGPLAIVVRALATVCREHPLLNASFDAERAEIVTYEEIHVGIATDTERGLMVPVVRSAGEKTILAIEREIAELSAAARDGTIRPEQMLGGTITVSNVGTFGAEFGTPIVNPPEGAILALGVIEPRALVVDGRVEARPAGTLSLTFDHRLLDGAQAGRALKSLRDLLQDPAALRTLPR
ncbi:MAG TPA: dihydrolipoamide acetyltransferase family protein [Actinomycetota bacterium]|nr:dihydrolipoamide acetyltransferase family protein [Actinomycetota bacterium]